ncbi:hypothetical protein [Chitinimonas lacunae]|uniref:Uncharacterized protein n=1 Tax=Chitinimonas lacunae TaxID=1963018 RepID=A0ABV8MQG2_9NEIS
MTAATLPKEERYPPDQRLDGRLFALAEHGKALLEQVFIQHFDGRRWPIEGYTLLINLYEENGCGSVSFCPKIEQEVGGTPFEVPDQGLWQNGPGVTFYLDLKDYSLIKRVFMR